MTSLSVLDSQYGICAVSQLGAPSLRRYVGVSCAERLVPHRICERVKAMQPMSPTANDDEVAEPRTNGVYEAGKATRVLH